MNLRLSLPKEEQLPIWSWVGDRQVITAAAVRTVTGDWCEEASARILGGVRHRTDGQADFCPDVVLPGRARGEVFIESKSCRHGRALVFKKRLANDLRLAKEGKRLLYLFWRIQGALPTLPAALSALRTAMVPPAATRVLVVPAERIRGWCRCQVGVPMWQGGPVGYRIPWGVLELLARTEARKVGVWETNGRVYGSPVRANFVGSAAWELVPALTDLDRQEANRMHCELLDCRPVTVLAPAPEPRFAGQMVRVVENRNPDWYRRLAKHFGTKSRTKHQRRRSDDYDIRRPEIERALERLAAGAHPCTPNDFRLLPLIRSHIP